MGRAAHLMTSTLTLSAPTGAANSYGTTSYAAQTTQAAYIENDSKLVQDADGQAVLSSHKVITETAIDRRSRVWLPGDDTSSVTAARRIVESGRVGSPRDAYSLYQYRLA